MDIKTIIEEQKAFFRTGSTKPVKFRKTMLRELALAIRNNEDAINDAMMQDMNKAPMEVYMTETGLVLSEIRYHLKHIDKWMRNKRVRTPLTQFPAVSFRSPEPLGRVLIMAPWNYPFQLCMMPLIGAISAGCTAVVKPSAYAPATSSVIAKILGDTFNERYIAVVEGGREENSALLEERFDHIFYQWLENTDDWCISRQLWWGHRIPVFTNKKTGEVVCSEEVLPASEWDQDPDVLDTWFSSALAPFAFLGWPEETELYKRYYPLDVMVTAYDIIFFWVERMAFQGLHFSKVMYVMFY